MKSIIHMQPIHMQPPYEIRAAPEQEGYRSPRW